METQEHFTIDVQVETGFLASLNRPSAKDEPEEDAGLFTISLPFLPPPSPPPAPHPPAVSFLLLFFIWVIVIKHRCRHFVFARMLLTCGTCDVKYLTGC